MKLTPAQKRVADVLKAGGRAARASGRFGGWTLEDALGWKIDVSQRTIGEAGELANQVKKILRDDDGRISEARRLALISELGDVVWYSAAIASELGVSLDSVAEANLDKLARRAASGTIKGGGDER